MRLFGRASLVRVFGGMYDWETSSVSSMKGLRVGFGRLMKKEDGTLLTGSYYPRPSTKPLDCDLTKSGFIRLRFRGEGCAGWGRQTRESEGSMGLHRSWTESGLDAWEDWTTVGPRDSEPSPPTEDS